jgi:aryl-alcohol dehydrogenase-like predicted oxidoreductase
MNRCAKLVLGTAQWGLAYGVTNAVGRPAVETVSRMLDAAARAGSGMLDTARAYGDAERIIGDSTAAREFAVVTKTDPNALADPNDAARGISASLAALRRDRVHAILIHHGDRMLVDGDGQWTALQHARRQGLASRIGVSVYNPDVLRHLLQRFEIEIVQIPASLYDRRFERCGLLDELAQRGIEVHVRSVFLQGLILAPPKSLPAAFAGLSAHQKRFHAHLAACGLTPLEAALGHALSDERISRVVVGAECDTQLEQIFAAASRCTTALDPAGTVDFALEDERMILPYNWPANLRIVPPAPGKQGGLA